MDILNELLNEIKNNNNININNNLDNKTVSKSNNNINNNNNNNNTRHNITYSLKHEAFALQKDFPKIESELSNFISYITSNKDAIEELKNNFFTYYGTPIDISMPDGSSTPIQCRFLAYDKNKPYNAIENIKSSYQASKDLIADSISSSNGTFYINTYNDNIKETVQINIPVEISNQKKNTKISVSQSTINNATNTLKHELTHAFDHSIKTNTNSNSNKNHFQINDNIEAFQQCKNKYQLFMAIDLLYRLWDSSEFNAQQLDLYQDNINNNNNNSNSDIINSLKSNYTSLDSSIFGSPKEIIENLSKINDDQFWSILKIITINGLSNQNTINKISNYSPAQFKAFFLDTSSKLEIKFSKKAQKNTYTNIDINNDKNILFNDLYSQITSFISDNDKSIFSSLSPTTITLHSKLYQKNKIAHLPLGGGRNN